MANTVQITIDIKDLRAALEAGKELKSVLEQINRMNFNIQMSGVANAVNGFASISRAAEGAIANVEKLNTAFSAENLGFTTTNKEALSNFYNRVAGNREEIAERLKNVLLEDIAFFNRESSLNKALTEPYEAFSKFDDKSIKAISELGSRDVLEVTDNMLEWSKELYNYDLSGKADEIYDVVNAFGDMQEAMSPSKFSFEDFANKFSDTVQTIASVATGGLGAITDFTTGIVDAFSGMASILHTDILQTVVRTLTYNATNAITSQLSGIIQRYDIMSTFTDYMNLAGVDTDTANAALGKVDLSIRGIPIGLDEAAFRLRRYQMYLGDIDRATNLTIGVQNALMAGGASEQMRNTAYTQIDRLLATGKLSQARQWMSLFNGLGVSLRFLKDELALDPTMSMQQVASDLASGAIATDDFLHAMERLADNEGLTQALNIYKGTVEAWMANIRNAIKRGGQTIMEAMDDMMFDQFGQGITGVLRIVRDEIDAISQAAANFLRNNPQLFEILGNVVNGLFNRIQSADFGAFIGKVVDRLGELGYIILRIFDNLPAGFLSDFVSFLVTVVGPLSAIFKLVQSGLPFLIGVFEAMKDFDFAGLIEKIVHQVEIFANLIARVLDIIPDGILGDIMAFALVWGKPLIGLINGISGALTNLFNGIAGVGGQGMFGGIGGMIRGLGGLIGYPMVGVIGAIAAGIGIIVSQTKEYYRELHKLTDEKFAERNPDFENLITGTEAMVTNMRRTREGWETTIDTLSKKAETAHDLIAEISRMDKQIGDTEDMRERNRLIAEQESLISRLGKVSDISLTLESETGLLTEESNAVLGLADSYIELAEAKAKSEAYETNIEEAYQGLFEAQAQREQLVEQRRRLRTQLTNQRVAIAVAEANTDVPHTDLSAAGDAEFEAEANRRSRALEEAQDDYKKTAEEITTTEQEIDNLDEMIAAYNKDIDYFGIGLQEVIDEMDYLSKIDFTPIGSDVSFNSLDENVQRTIAAFNALEDSARDAVHSIGTGFAGVEKITAASASKIIENLTSQSNAYKEFNDDVTQIIKFAAENEDLDFSTVFRRLGESSMDEAREFVPAIVEAINSYNSGDTGILDSLISESDIANSAEKLSAALMQTIEAAATDPEVLSTIAEYPLFFGEDGNLADAIFGEGFTDSVLEASEEGIEPLNEELETTADNAGEAKVAVGNMAEAMLARMGVVNTFAQTMRNLAGNIGAAEGAALGLARAINNIPSNKTVRVNYNNYRASGVVVTDSWGQPITAATGGYIHGPGVPSLAIGTDTVPAMLTPGEYVVRRDAVNMFGQTFLEAVNGMDVGAAYDAMMSRVSVPHGSTYNYYDNHAAVNMNFYGNTGQDFSQRKAFNFISKL